jgi:hypothetical protein
MSAAAAAPAKKTVVLALPGRQFSDNFVISLVQSLYALWNSNRYNVVISPAYSSFVSFSRMKTLGLNVLRGSEQKPFPNLAYDYWLTIDSDIVFTPSQIVELLDNAEHHPVVSGLYRMTDGNFACVKDWDIEHYKKNGSFKFISPREVEEYRNTTGLKFLEVAYNGMGFMCVRREALEALSYPYFHRPLEEIHAMAQGPAGADGTVPDPVPIVIRDMCSEDVSFCKNLAEAGFPVHVNLGLVVGHEKPIVI